MVALAQFVIFKVLIKNQDIKVLTFGLQLTKKALLFFVKPFLCWFEVLQFY